MPRASVTHNCGGHAADWPGASDEDVLAENVERQCSVHGVTERVEDGLHVAAQMGIVDPYIGHRQSDVLSKRPRPVDADALRVLAQMPPAGEAVAATATDDVAFSGNDVADVEVGDVAADLDDAADEFVAHHHGHRNCLLGPSVPFVYVQVGAAD